MSTLDGRDHRSGHASQPQLDWLGKRNEVTKTIPATGSKRQSSLQLLNSYEKKWAQERPHRRPQRTLKPNTDVHVSSIDQSRMNV